MNTDIVALLLLEEEETNIMIFITMIMVVCNVFIKRYSRGCSPRSRMPYSSRLKTQIDNINRLIQYSDLVCIEQLRMSRNAFNSLCQLLRTNGRLQDSRYVSVEEKVAMFLHILAYHVKNRVIKFRFVRSGQTVSKYFNAVLLGILKLSSLLVVKPQPIPDDCVDEKWTWFKGCLGALDGTYIKVNVSELDKPRYRSRKGDIAINVLGVCNREMNFIYVLFGWEGSAADGRILRDAIARPNGLKVPMGKYYLCDAGYTNGEGFLTPYRGQRYHLSVWKPGALAPQNHEEYFNMKHAKVRNVIEKAFGLLKIRWTILRSPSYYPIKTHGRIVSACVLLHNFIRKEMEVDPAEQILEDQEATQNEVNDEEIDEAIIDTVETSDEWTAWRDELAIAMYNAWNLDG